MPGEKADSTSSLLVYLPDLLDGIDLSLLTDFLSDPEACPSSFLSTLPPADRTSLNPALKQYLIAESEREPEFLNRMTMLWVDSNKPLWARVALSGMKELRESLDALIRQYGTSPLRIALLMDDRQTVRQLASRVGLASVECIAEPEPVNPETRGKHDKNRRAKSLGADWVPVISTMLKKGEYEAARIFCETLRETEPESLHAHLALEHVYAKTGDRGSQMDECLWIAKHLRAQGQPTRACAFACRALEVKHSSRQAKMVLKDLLEQIDLSDPSVVCAVRGLLGRLKNSKPAAYREAFAVVDEMGEQFAGLLENPVAVLSIDKTLNLNDGSRSIRMSIGRIIDAVDANDVEAVGFVRCALERLRASHPDLCRKIMESLDAQGSFYVSAITHGNQPVVVDGSDVAWHESRKKPKLENILALRSELRADGYFPVYIYVDAALSSQVDKQSALKELIDQGAVVAVDPRTDADEAITEQARRLSCPVVTNDRMADWDPRNEIPKVRFAIDRFGTMVYDR